MVALPFLNESIAISGVTIVFLYVNEVLGFDLLNTVLFLLEIFTHLFFHWKNFDFIPTSEPGSNDWYEFINDNRSEMGKSVTFWPKSSRNHILKNPSQVESSYRQLKKFSSQVKSSHVSKTCKSKSKVKSSRFLI